MCTIKIGINLLCFQQQQRAGAWVFIKRLLEALPETEQCEFVFFCPKGFNVGEELKIPEGIRYRTVQANIGTSRIRRILYEQIMLPLKALAVDVLFSPCTANPVIHPGVRTITTIHDLTPFYVKKKYNSVQTAYIKAMTYCLAHTSDQIITVSESSRLDLVKKLKIKNAQISVIYNSVRDLDHNPEAYENFFLYVGTIQPGKNITMMIQAFALFSKQYDRCGHRLVIAGAYGWGGEPYSALIKKLGLQNLVEVAGYVSEERLNDLYSRCKGLILISLYEGFGIPVLEALSWHKPSVFSNLSSLPEVAGRTGISVDPSNCEEVARAIGLIADAPRLYVKERDLQLAKFSMCHQVKQFVAVLGIKRG